MTTDSSEFWDGNWSLPFVFDDGGRAASGRRGNAGDCVVRAIAIAARLDYGRVYAALASGMGEQRKSKGRTARNGVSTSRKWFKDYMRALGFSWTPAMTIGSGCKVHLLRGELPLGRLVVSVSRHYVAVIDGVIHDTYDPQRQTIYYENGKPARMSHRCVYGWWALGGAA